jgi:hypothetical protein
LLVILVKSATRAGSVCDAGLPPSQFFPRLDHNLHDFHELFGHLSAPTARPGWFPPQYLGAIGSLPAEAEYEQSATVSAGGTAGLRDAALQPVQSTADVLHLVVIPPFELAAFEAGSLVGPMSASRVMFE